MSFRQVLLTLASAWLLAWSGTAGASTESEEVMSLHRAGKTDAALQRADAFLMAQARDPEMRLVKALLLADAGRRPEAIKLLEGLAQDFPDLPEVYNNMATLHAAEGDFIKARASLEFAVRLNPAYATAQRNLADVHLALARRAYEVAARLTPGQADIAARLELLARLLPSPAGATMSPNPPPAR